MGHKELLLIIFSLTFLIALFHTIKNKPDYLVLLGIRGLFSYVLIQFINYLCTVAHLSVLVLANPVTVAFGGLLGFPGILFLYMTRLYFHSF